MLLYCVNRGDVSRRFVIPLTDGTTPSGAPVGAIEKKKKKKMIRQMLINQKI